jgi:hypothetical protein
MEISDQGFDLVSLPKEIADLIFSYFSRYKYRYRIRQVSKKWLMAAKISNFVIGYFLKAEIAQIAKSFSKYSNLVGLKFAKDCEEFLRTSDLEPISIIHNLSSLTIVTQQLYDREDPRFISALTNLEYLNIPRASKNTIEPLTKLRYLNIHLHPSDQESKLYSVRLPFLESATIHGINYEHCPSFTESTRLTHLTLHEVTSLPPNYLDLHSNLKELAVAGGTHPISLAIKLPNLESLIATFIGVDDWSSLQKLTRLEMSQAEVPTNHTNFRGISLLTNLQQLLLFGMQRSNEEMDLGPLTKLSSIFLHKLDVPVSYAKILERITTDKFKELHLNVTKDDMECISKFGNLTFLSLAGDAQMMGYTDCDISMLTTLTNLEALQLEKFNSLNMEGISKLGKLTYLYLMYNTHIQSCSELKSLPHLAIMQVSESPVDIRGITSLNNLYVRTQEWTYNSSDLVGLTSLIAPYLDKDIFQDILTWTALETARIPGNFENTPERIQQLTALKNLKTLELYQTSWHDSFSVLTQLHWISPQPSNKFDQLRKLAPNFVMHAED